jgi:hypothetical protein
MTEQLKSAIDDIAGLNEIDAAELADAIIDIVIDALIHDPAAPKYTALEWRLVLASVHALIVVRINARIADSIARQDALNAVERESF